MRTLTEYPSHRSCRRSLLLFILLAPFVLLLSACNDDPSACTSGKQTCILFDQYHARKQNFTDYTLDKNQFNYVGSFSYTRFANHIARNDYEILALRESRLTPERLSHVDALFINLVDNSRPDFTTDEVDAIINFVKNGGGLFVIADHTNVYDHAERINRFLEPMGIEVLYHTVCDSFPEYSVSGSAWVLARHLVQHPVTDGVEEFCIQTGGPMRLSSNAQSLATTSDTSWADFWNKSYGEGYYGDWNFNRSDGDLNGPLNILAVATFGKGRVVVAPDQNMFGDPWLFYTDNFQLAMNSIEWISKREDDSVHLRDQPVPGLKVALDQRFTGYAAGNTFADGFYSYLINSNRDQSTNMRGSIHFGDEDVFEFTTLRKEIPAADIERLRTKMLNGATLLIHIDPDLVSDETLSFIKELDSSFTMQCGSKLGALTDLSSFKGTKPRKKGRFTLKGSNGFNIEDLPYSDWSENPNQYPNDHGRTQNDPNKVGALGQENERAYPFLYDCSSTWGDPLLETSDGKISIARTKKMGEGSLIILIQDGLFHDRAMGNPLQTPNQFNRPQIELNYSLLAYLRTLHTPSK